MGMASQCNSGIDLYCGISFSGLDKSEAWTVIFAYLCAWIWREWWAVGPNAHKMHSVHSVTILQKFTLAPWVLTSSGQHHTNIMVCVICLLCCFFESIVVLVWQRASCSEVQMFPFLDRDLWNRTSMLGLTVWSYSWLLISIPHSLLPGGKCVQDCNLNAYKTDWLFTIVVIVIISTHSTFARLISTQSKRPPASSFDSATGRDLVSNNR